MDGKELVAVGNLDEDDEIRKNRMRRLILSTYSLYYFFYDIALRNRTGLR